MSNTFILDESDHLKSWYIRNVVNEVSFLQLIVKHLIMDFLFEHFILDSLRIFNLSDYFWRKALEILEFFLEKVELAL